VSVAGEQQPATPNWQDALGNDWAGHADDIDAMFQPFGERAMDALVVEHGDAVIDVGCGSGGTTLELARRAGPDGRALGVDPSEPQLEVGRRRAEAASLANATFLCADASNADFGATFDAVFSRFGVMFFQDPIAAFRHIAGALRERARLSFACWQGREHNDWMTSLHNAVGHVVELPPLSGPREQGGAMFAEPDYARRVLEGAGFDEVRFEPVVQPVTLPGGGDALDVARQAVGIMPGIANAYRAADEDKRTSIRDSMAAALTPHRDGTCFRLGAAVWVVTAVRP
jgi:SAM-dependent methyltransferase